MLSNFGKKSCAVQSKKTSKDSYYNMAWLKENIQLYSPVMVADVSALSKSICCLSHNHWESHKNVGNNPHTKNLKWNNCLEFHTYFKGKLPRR